MTDTQNDAIERWGFKWHGHDHGTHERMFDGYWTPWHIAAARITELEAIIAGEPDRMREVVERCAKVADDLARVEDRAVRHAETPADKGRCAVIAAEFRRAAKAIRAQENSNAG